MCNDLRRRGSSLVDIHNVKAFFTSVYLCEFYHIEKKGETAYEHIGMVFSLVDFHAVYKLDQFKFP